MLVQCCFMMALLFHCGLSGYCDLVIACVGHSCSALYLILRPMASSFISFNDVDLTLCTGVSVLMLTGRLPWLYPFRCSVHKLISTECINKHCWARGGYIRSLTWGSYRHCLTWGSYRHCLMYLLLSNWIMITPLFCLSRVKIVMISREVNVLFIIFTWKVT